MKLVPRTLFGRNLLLLVALIIASQIVSAIIVRQLVVKPRIDQLAAFSASNLEAVRAALESLPPADRQRFVDSMNRVSGLHIERAREPVSGFAQPAMPAQRLFLRRLGDLLPDDRTDVEWKTEPENTLWVRLYVGDDSYWVTAAAGPLDLGLPRAWAWVTLVSTLLAALGAYLIQRRVDRPIRALVAAAGQIGAGKPPDLLAESGPREIVELAHGFNRMSERLQAADAERAIMLAGVSHDLRSPLSKLRLGLEIAAERIEPDIRGGMERNIEAMDAIIGQFLDFARPETEETPESTDLAALLAQTVREQAGDMVCEFRLAPLPPLRLRRRAMTRLIANLVENARRYGAPPLSVRSGGDGTIAWFVIADHGPGIAEAERERIRKPFARGDAARSGGSGAGLGLAIADRIVAMHGGRMTLATPPGGGLEVRVELPVAAGLYSAT
jgi:two-component system osmolarity sensor histidine kinase EnvZ